MTGSDDFPAPGEPRRRPLLPPEVRPPFRVRDLPIRYPLTFMGLCLLTVVSAIYGLTGWLGVGIVAGCFVGTVAALGAHEYWRGRR